MTNLSARDLKNYIKKAVFIWAGVCLIIIGIVGTLLPVIPGFLFLFLGLIFLSKGSESFKNVSFIKVLLSEGKKQLEKKDNLVIKKLLSIL